MNTKSREENKVLDTVQTKSNYTGIEVKKQKLLSIIYSN